MKQLILALALLAIGSSLLGAADNIVISQANGQNAIIRATQSGSVYTLVVSCGP